MPYQTTPCPICGNAVTTYTPDPWPKAVRLPGGKEVVVKDEAELEALGAEYRPEEPKAPAQAKAPEPPPPKAPEIPTLNLKPEPSVPPMKPKATAP